MRFAVWRRESEAPPPLHEILGDVPLPALCEAAVAARASLDQSEPGSPATPKALSRQQPLYPGVLDLARAAGVGGGRRPRDDRQRLENLGPKALKGLVLVMATRDALPSSPVPGFTPDQYWRSAARRGAVAHALALALHPASATTSLVVSLLQDMAIPVLAHRRIEDYGPLLRHAQETGESLEALEAVEFGWTHADVACWWLSGWDVDQAITSAVGAHHKPGAPIDTVPPAVQLASLIDDDKGDLEQLVELARSDFMLSAEEAIGAIGGALDQADQIAALLAA